MLSRSTFFGWSVCCVSLLLSVSCAAPPKFDSNSNLMVDEQGQLKLSKPLYQCYLDSGKIALATELPRGQKASITYWEKGDRKNPHTIELSPGWDRIHFAIPENVKPSEKYGCQVEIDGKMSSVFEFMPGVQPGRPFKFMAVGDTRPGYLKPHQEVVEQMEKIQDATFYVHLGDFVNESTPMADWNTFFSIHEKLLSRIPILPVIGNHDLSKSMYFSGLFLMKARSKDPKHYYGITYGNLKLIALDSNVPINEGDEQYKFLIEQLQTAKAQKLDHIFVALHHPIYGAGKHGSNLHLINTLSPVFEQYGVAAVLSGHDHSYERSKKINGVVYIVTGGGGSKLYDVEPKEFTAKAARSFHFVVFSVDGAKLEMKAINHKGNVIDQYTF